MPEQVIRNRFGNASSERDTGPLGAARTRPGFGVDDDPLAELARIVGETDPGAPRDLPTAPREYPRRDTSWRDPSARTTVRAGITPQPMPGQLSDLEAELFQELRPHLPPAPDLQELGLPNARSAQPMTPASQPGRPPLAVAIHDDYDDEVTLPVQPVVRPPVARMQAPEEVGMQQPPRYVSSPAASSHVPPPQPAYAAPAHQTADHYDDYGVHPEYAEHDAYHAHDPAGAMSHGHESYHGSEPDYRGVSVNPAYAHTEDAQFRGDLGYDEDDDPLPQAIARPRAEPKPKSGMSGIVMIAAIAAGVLVVGGGGVFAYRSMMGSGATGANAPLIKADTRPVKEQAAPTPLAATGPNLDASKPDGQDRLVTRQEDPVDQVPGKAPVRVVGSGTGTPTLAPIQRVRSVIVRPDGSIVTPDAEPAQPKPVTPVQAATPVPSIAPNPVPAPSLATLPPPQQVAQGDPLAQFPKATSPSTTARVAPVQQTPAPVQAPAPVAVAPKPVVQAVAVTAPPPTKPALKPATSVSPQPSLVPHTTTNNAPLALGPGSPTPSAANLPPVRVATAQPQAPAPVAPPRAVATDSVTGEFMVQISSARSDAEARRALQDAERKYAGLGIKGGDVQQADLGARGTYFRARLAGGSHEQAAALCSQIKAQGGDCVVAKR